MTDERAFASLTLLVAVTEQAIVELNELEPVPLDFVKELTVIRDDATLVANRLRDPREEIPRG